MPASACQAMRTRRNNPENLFEPRRHGGHSEKQGEGINHGERQEERLFLFLTFAVPAVVNYFPRINCPALCVHLRFNALQRHAQ